MRCESCNLEFENGSNIIKLFDVFIHVVCEKRYRNSINKRKFPCPQCGTAGKVNHKTKTEKKEVNLSYDETPDCGYNGCWGCYNCRNRVKTIDVPIKISCDLCNGHGYTEIEAKPVTAVVGWNF